MYFFVPFNDFVLIRKLVFVQRTVFPAFPAFTYHNQVGWSDYKGNSGAQQVHFGEDTDERCDCHPHGYLDIPKGECVRHWYKECDKRSIPRIPEQVSAGSNSRPRPTDSTRTSRCSLTINDAVVHQY
jgi:hypothetical protein